VNQRSVVGVGASLLIASLALSGCGTKSSSTDTTAASKKCDLKIAVFGPLTGPNANLGIYIQNGAKLAIDQYNTKNSSCKVTMVNFDSQGEATQAPGLAKKAIDDKKIVGIVGPAFSGESKAADPLFNEAGLVTVTPSATNPNLSTNGWKIFFRNIGNDATQGPAAAKYIKDTIKSTKTFVIDDASEYGKGLADIVRKDLGAQVVGNDSIQQKQTDFGPSVTKVKASKADTLFFGGYSPEAAPLIKQLRAAGWKGTYVVADGAKDQAFLDNAKSAAEGTIITCPCATPESAPEFAADYKKAYNQDPSTYSGEGFDSAQVLLDGIAAGKDRAGMVDFVKAYDKKGVTKQVKFDAKGEPTEIHVYAYKVKDGKIVTVAEIK
jgi:branched-chain amino acid transport system substrate-binding protein